MKSGQLFCPRCETVLPPLEAVEIIAHRGASQDAPENTLASFRLGWEQRADADELDIYLTKDGQVVDPARFPSLPAA